MKNSNLLQISTLVILVLGMSGCSPFGNQSLVQQISDSIAVFIPGKTSTSVVSSASGSLTVPSTPGVQPYFVTHSVGDAYQQPTNRANVNGVDSGYKVFSTVQGDIQ